MSLRGTKSDINSESRKFTIKGSEITEIDKHVESKNKLESSEYEYTATKVPVAFENVCTAALSQQDVASPPLHQNIQTEFTNTNEGLSSSNNQIVAMEDNLDEYAYPSDSDITLDYDDDVRDPDWKNPDQRQSSDTDENNNINEHIHHVEVVKPQRSDPEPSRKRKNEKTKEIQKKKRMCGENYKGVKKNKEDVKVYCIERDGRFLCPSGCGRKCQKSKDTNCKLLAEADGATIFNNFWKQMSWAEKRCYVTSHVDRCEVKQRTTGPGESSRRNYSYIYFLKKRRRSCKSMPVYV
ncbi:hypothetical protein DPMN_078478 [Dreissena polymorpha]|uniref:Uncharacterized protein n=1 Tax=Dreissena polymorpha TaxID=45954 RepID=A0A9D4BS66_DREPO|nr:hypothetical protein DPMN_078478 [Dreissena polymorpha]